MTDVAHVAGVSHQTVSRVLNEHPNVSAKTRARVQAAIDQLGYRPNRAARALVTGRSQVIGVVAQSSALFGPAAVLTAVEQALSDAGFAVGVASVPVLDKDSIALAVGRLMEQRVGGIVVVAPIVSASDAIADLPADLPLVSIDGDPDSTARLVTVDQQLGARLATEHLLAAGHETVWHVSGPNDWFDSAGRLAGWRTALADAGAAEPPVIKADWSLASGYDAGKMLARIPDAHAVFAANDHLALGIMKAMREAGRVVPDDISIVGFDDIPEAAYLDPALTTVRPDFAAVGEHTVRMLQLQLEDGTSRVRSMASIPPVLIKRASVAHPRGLSA
jgi:DNA-binding LacI/PurR family transcriptional regulator